MANLTTESLTQPPFFPNEVESLRRQVADLAHQLSDVRCLDSAQSLRLVSQASPGLKHDDALSYLTEDILASLTDVLVAVDKDWRVTYLNPHGSAAWGSKRRT